MSTQAIARAKRRETGREIRREVKARWRSTSRGGWGLLPARYLGGASASDEPAIRHEAGVHGLILKYHTRGKGVNANHRESSIMGNQRVNRAGTDRIARPPERLLASDGLALVERFANFLREIARGVGLLKHGGPMLLSDFERSDIG